MTVAEKSTELGYSLSDIWWDNKTLCDNLTNDDDTWVCTIVQGAIDSDDNQRGSAIVNYCYDSQIDVSITENSTLAQIEFSSKEWLDTQDYIENTIPLVYTPKTS